MRCAAYLFVDLMLSVNLITEYLMSSDVSTRKRTTVKFCEMQS